MLHNIKPPCQESPILGGAPRGHAVGGASTLRPSAGILVRESSSLSDVFEKMVTFPDRHRLQDEDAARLRAGPVDVTLRCTDGSEFSVTIDTLLRHAKMFKEFNEIVFDIPKPSQVCDAHSSLICHFRATAGVRCLHRVEAKSTAIRGGSVCLRNSP